MSAAASRAVLRHTKLLSRRTALRHASTTSKATEAASNTASKAKEKTSEATSKASQGLSRVTSSAQSGISKASENITSGLSKIGGRTGRMISSVQSLIPPTIYYSKVGLELSKLVFQGQKMSPPNVAQFQHYLQNLTRGLRHPMSMFTKTATETNAVTPENMLQQIRNLDRQQLGSFAVIAAEVLGFFTVGEMIGRLKLVGYHGDVHHTEQATPHEGV